MTDQEEYKVIRGSVNGQAKYCRIPIRRKTDNAMAIQMLQKEVDALKNPVIMDNDCLEIELGETDFERRIEVLEMAIAALEKQAPAKLSNRYEDRYGDCQRCHGFVVGGMKFCSECGQAIDWEENAG